MTLKFLLIYQDPFPSQSHVCNSLNIGFMSTTIFESRRGNREMPVVDTISQRNINILSYSKLEYKEPIIDKAPEWLQEQQQQQRQGQGRMTHNYYWRRTTFDTKDGVVLGSTPPYTQFDAHTQMSSCQIDGARPSENFC